MHLIPSGTNSAANRIAQKRAVCKSGVSRTSGSLKAAALLCVLLFFAQCASTLAHGFSARSWNKGWSAWKNDDAKTALKYWDGRFASPVEIRPSRRLYWKIRALEASGDDEKARVTASLLAAIRPLDFYTFVIAREGKYPAVTKAATRALEKARRPARWENEAEAAAEVTGVSKNIIFAVMKRESKFKERAVSKKGAAGLMQIMPKTAKEVARRVYGENFSLFDPGQNIMIGTLHIARLKRNFSNALPAALAAYNAGEASVRLWGISAADWVEWIEDVPYPETREYVRAVLENTEIYGAADGASRAENSFFANALARPVFIKNYARMSDGEMN